MISKETALGTLKDIQLQMVRYMKELGIGDIGMSLSNQQFEFVKEYIEGSVVEISLADKIREILGDDDAPFHENFKDGM